MRTQYGQTSLKNAFSQTKGGDNARSVRKVTGFVDRHYLKKIAGLFQNLGF
jgi:hypothetical protein